MNTTFLMDFVRALHQLSRCIVGGLCVSLVSSCAEFSAGTRASAVHTPDVVLANHAGDATLPPGLRRVVLMPLVGGTVAPPESVAQLDPVITAALQLQNRFEIVPLTREDCRRYFQADEISSTAPIPTNFMAVIRREFAADAVMFVDVTVYSAYRPLAIGLRAKLATVANVRLVWTFDNVFSADDPAIAASAGHYFQNRDEGGLAPEVSPVVMQSPVRFATYAATATFATLPPLARPAGTGKLAKVAQGTANAN